jgi:DNA polymerase III sliding clamp (beta) subunit (PCNA family)
MLLLPRNLAKVAELVATDTGRAAMSGIRVLEFADSYRLEVTDGRRLLIVRGPHKQGELTPQDRLTIAALDDAPNGTFTALVPAADWTKAFRAAKKGDPVGLVLGGLDVTFGTGSHLLRTRPVEGRFPDVNIVIPKKPALFSIAVNPLLLAELLTVMANVGGEDERKVFLHFYGPKVPMGVTLKNGEGIVADAILMPLI